MDTDFRVVRLLGIGELGRRQNIMFIARFDRFELRKLSEQDAGALRALEPRDLSHCQGEWFCVPGREGEYIDQTLREYSDMRSLRTGIWDGDTLAGIVSLREIDASSKSAGVSYVLSAPYRGRGIATMACRELISHGFNHLGLNRIQILADTANKPSLAVPERLGFTKEGVIRDCYRVANGFRDVVQYSLLASERRAGKA